VETSSLEKLLDAINFRGNVTGSTHDFYRYPARFSPPFARAAIDLFTEPGDTVLDPFVGGSTSLVEAMASGRNAVGLDISQLAVFLARVKTTLLPKTDLETVQDWAIETSSLLSPFQPVKRHSDWQEAGYQKHVPWRLRKAAEQAINAAERLPQRLRPLARCIVLRTIQWAVDCKKHFPSMPTVRQQFMDFAVIATDGLEELGQRVLVSGRKATVEVFNEPVESITAVASTLLKTPAKLVITSPPYPGVHVLYHRWQIRGGKESPAPFWIADCLDGQGNAFYTFGDRRKQTHEEEYFGRLQRAFTEVRKVVAAGAVVVQLVGFAKPQVHLTCYLKAMREGGFEEYDFEDECHRLSQRAFWRSVPHRKWYTWLRPEAKQAAEILLVHRAR
jgi:DNA modification methylase